jgi:hypothetical protein
MKKNNIFWISFSDLMTSLFFIMLVLFVLTIGFLQIKNKENERLISELENKGKGLIEEKERLEKLLNLEKQFEPLIKDNSFYYLPDCKKFIAKDLMGIEIFKPDGILIKPEYIDRTKNAGKKIEGFLKELNKKNSELSYLLVIEGNMANDFKKSKPVDRPDFYLKSYQRALAVYNLWLQDGTNLRKYNVEVMICGSGLNGLCRDPIEDNNKRFSIQIIPKVSK